MAKKEEIIRELLKNYKLYLLDLQIDIEKMEFLEEFRLNNLLGDFKRRQNNIERLHKLGVTNI